MTKTILPILILLGLVFLQSQSLFAYARLNAGYLIINQLTTQPNEWPEKATRPPEAFLQQASEVRVTSRAAWRGLGLTSVLFGDLDNAALAWQKAQTPVAELVQFGEKTAEAGRQDEALRWFQVAAEMDLAAAATPLAEQLRKLKDFEGASDVWQKALATYPEGKDRLVWWRGYSHSLRSNEEWQQSVEVSEKALNEFPEDPQLLAGLGSALISLDADYATVTSILKQAIALDESYAEAYTILARLMIRERRYEEAFNYFDQAIERDPSIKWWHVARADMAWRWGDLELARTLLLETVGAFPDYAPAYYELAGILKLVDNPVQAQTAIEQAIDLHDAPPLNYYVRAGDIYAWSNQIDRARSAYQRAAKISPDDKRVVQGLESLRKSE